MAEPEKKEGVQMMEIHGIIRMLKATSERAEHLRMTGGPDEKGSAAGVRQYNAILKRISNFVFADPELFTPLEEGAPFVDMIMCCEQLAAYLEGVTEETRSDIGKKPPTQIMGPVSIKISDPSNLGDLGELIRQAMPSWIRDKMDADEAAKAKVPEEKQNERSGEQNKG